MNLKIYTINKLYKVSRTCKGKNNTSRIIFAITWYFLQREFEIYTVQGFENIFKEKNISITIFAITWSSIQRKFETIDRIRGHNSRWKRRTLAPQVLT
jgi:hypothetical protein